MDSGIPQGLFEQSAVGLLTPGYKLTLNNGDVFRYVKVGGSNISHGKMQLAPVAVAEQVNETGAGIVAPVGARQVSVNVGAAAVVADTYAGGYLVVNDATGEGYTYRIAGHTGISSAGGVIVVDLLDPIQVALVASTSEITLVHNPFRGVVEAASSVRRAAGVPMIDLTAGYFGWTKTKGTAATLIGTAATSGARLMPEGAGAISDNTDVTSVQTEVIVALASLGAGVSGEYNPVELIID